LNAKIVAGNIAAGLKRVDPKDAAVFDANLARFRDRIDVSLYGPTIAKLIPPGTLDSLARQGRLVQFLRGKDYKGKKLIGDLGGWLGKGLPFRGGKIVTYHQNWTYFTDLFGLVVVGDVEPKPGIPPSAKHVHDLIETMTAQKVGVVLAPDYFDPAQATAIAQRTGAKPVIVPLGPSSTSPEGYFQLIDLWVDKLAQAFRS
jgi:ABC-type Zn uptake system ZnuABC Zn-binding protein ZnuA